MKYTHVIWDFNGTLLDDLNTCFICANRLLKNHSLPQLSSVEDYKAAFGFPIKEYYRRLGFDFSLTPYEVLAPEWVSYYNELDPADKLYPGIPELLEEAEKLGVSQIILSATELEMLKKQVSHLNILPYFDEVLGLSDIHAKSKIELAKAWRVQRPQASVLFFGDTDHDAEVAREIGADCILFASGHQPAEHLKAQSPLRQFDSPLDFLTKGGFLLL